jgi:outer membrane lipoprotein-sorting protein
MLRQACVWGLVAAALVSAVPAQADKVDEVQKAIAEKLKEHKSYRFKSITTTNFTNPQMKMESRSEMIYAARNEGDKQLSRIESTQQTKTVTGGHEQTMQTKSTTIMNGEYIYTLSEVDGQKMATKMKMDPKMAQAGPELNLREDWDTKILPDEKVDGRTAWVIEQRARDPQPMQPVVMTTYYCKDTGLALKMVGKDKDGNVMYESIIKDIELDPSLPKDHFEFKPPPGVQVMDMTQMQQGQSGGGMSSDDSDDAEEEKEAEPEPDKKKRKIPGLPF